MSGKIIVIEGTDSSGKETQTKLLEERLISEGKKCIHFSFPMYNTPTGKIIGEAYLGKSDMGNSLFEEGAINVDPKVVCLYYAADRKYNMPDILKYLADDYYVLLDRYTTSNLAYQGSKIEDSEERFNMYQWIDKLEYWLLQLPKPDKTIFLHVPYKFSKELKKNREITDEYEKTEDYLKKAEQAYIELSELYNWDIVNCVEDDSLKSIKEINDEIYNKVIEIK